MFNVQKNLFIKFFDPGHKSMLVLGTLEMRQEESMIDVRYRCQLLSAARQLEDHIFLVTSTKSNNCSWTPPLLTFSMPSVRGCVVRTGKEAILFKCLLKNWSGALNKQRKWGHYKVPSDSTQHTKIRKNKE